MRIAAAHAQGLVRFVRTTSAIKHCQINLTDLLYLMICCCLAELAELAELTAATNIYILYLGKL